METLIILHGWGSAPDRWSDVRDELEKNGVRTLVPNIPGFKDKIDEPWDMDRYAEWLDEMVGDEPVFLMGHSFGGGLVIKYTSEHPNKVKGLVLVGAAVIRSRSKKVLLMAFVSRILKKLSFVPGYERFRSFVYYRILKRPDYIRARGPMRQTLRNVVKEDLTPLLSSIKTEALILWGSEDKMTLIDEAQDVRDRLRNSRLEIFEGAGHLLYKDVDPEIMCKKILSFIR